MRPAAARPGRRAAPGGGGPPGGGGGGGAANRRPGEGTPGRRSASPATSRGTRPATSTSPMAWAPTTGSPRSTRTAASSSSGARPAPSPASSRGLKAIAIDAQGDVYVADAGNKRIQVFDGDGHVQAPVRQRRHAAGDVHDARRHAVPLHLALRRPRWHGGRRHLQGAARRHGGRQVRQPPASCRRSSASPTPSTAATRTTCSSAR